VKCYKQENVGTRCFEIKKLKKLNKDLRSRNLVPKSGLVKPLIKSGIRESLTRKLLGLAKDCKLIPLLQLVHLLVIVDKS